MNTMKPQYFLPLLLLILLVATEQVDATVPFRKSAIVQSGVSAENDLPNHDDVAAVTSVMRGGAKPTSSKEATSLEKKTPFGLPALVPRWTYFPLDNLFHIPFLWLAFVLDGQAKACILAMLGVHSLLYAATDFYGNGKTLVGSLFGITSSLPLSVMFAYDCLLTALFISLPSLVNGFTDKTAFVSRYLLGIAGSPLLFFVDFGDENLPPDTKRAKE